MTKKEAINALVTAAKLGQIKGMYSFEESSVIKEAVSVIEESESKTKE